MATETTLIDVKDFQNKNSDNIEAVSDSIYKLVFESLTHERIDSLEKSFKALSDNFETISNALNIENDNNNICFNYGRIAAMTELVLDLIDANNISCTLEQISKNYALLLPVLETIQRHNTISGVQLKKELKFKSSSNLSNFVRRIDKYELIHVKKIGTTSYLSLTRKGQQLLSQSKRSTANKVEHQIPVKQVYVLLDEMSEEIGKVKPNKLKVLHALSSQIDIKEKGLLRHKIDMVFKSSEKLKISKIRSMPDPAKSYENRLEQENNIFILHTYKLNAEKNSKELTGYIYHS